MKPASDVLKVFLDEGVPLSVGKEFEAFGHKVLYFKEGALPGSPDPLVREIAQLNDAILIALDGDMKQAAQNRGVGAKRYRRLSLIKLSCRETRAASRVAEAMSFIEAEWKRNAQKSARRIFIEIGNEYLKTNR